MDEGSAEAGGLDEADGPEREAGAGAESKVDSSTGSAKPDAPSRRNRSGSTRLPKGALRGQVEDYLAENPGDHSPVEIGQVLGRSSGAVANALETLVELGDAVRTGERPKRYSHAEHADDTDAARDASGRSTASGARATADASARGRRSGRAGVVGVGTYVTVLAVVPLEATGAVTTDDIAGWVRARLPEPVLFASATHGVTRAALSAGADPSSWPLDDPAPDDPAPASGATDAAGPPAAADAGHPDVAISQSHSSDGTRVDATGDAIGDEIGGEIGGETGTTDETPAGAESESGAESGGGAAEVDADAAGGAAGTGHDEPVGEPDHPGRAVTYVR